MSRVWRLRNSPREKQPHEKDPPSIRDVGEPRPGKRVQKTPPSDLAGVRGRSKKKHGVHNYSIFLHTETRQLFAYAEIEDEARWQAIAQTPECQKWWRHMSDVMPSNPDHSPTAVTLREVFHLD